MSVDFQEQVHGPSFQPSYELNQEEVTTLSANLLAERPANRKDQFVLYELDGTDPYSNLARSIEASIFDDSFDDKIADMEDGYGQYETASSFFLVMDQSKKEPIGALRIIRNSEAGLKTLNDISNDAYCKFDGEAKRVPIEEFQAAHAVADLDKAWDVGTVAVLPEYRTTAMKSSLSKNPQPNIMLYRALYVKAMNEGIEHFVAVIDSGAHRGLKLLGVPFVPIMDSEPFEFSGSKSSTALYGYVPEFFNKMESRFKALQEKHPVKSKFLARPLGQLMLGRHTDDKLFLNN